MYANLIQQYDNAPHVALTVPRYKTMFLFITKTGSGRMQSEARFSMCLTLNLKPVKDAILNWRGHTKNSPPVHENVKIQCLNKIILNNCSCFVKNSSSIVFVLLQIFLKKLEDIFWHLNSCCKIGPNHRIIDDRIEKNIKGRRIGHNLG